MVRCRSKSYQEIERVSSEGLSPSSKSSSRRVWGQNPGQLFLHSVAIRITNGYFFIRKIKSVNILIIMTIYIDKNDY